MKITEEQLKKILQLEFEKMPQTFKVILVLEKGPHVCRYCNNEDEYFCPYHNLTFDEEILLIPVLVEKKWMYHYEELINGYTMAQIEEMQRKHETEKNKGGRRVRNPRMPQKAKLNASKERIEMNI